MNDDDCSHTWGEAEECETGGGIVRTPLCTQCGAMKHEVDTRARQRLEASRVETWRPVATNQPPTGARVHDFQTEMFTDQ